MKIAGEDETLPGREVFFNSLDNILVPPEDGRPSLSETNRFNRRVSSAFHSAVLF